MPTSGEQQPLMRETRSGVKAKSSTRATSSGATAASSGERSVVYHLNDSCSRLFRRRRLLAFLRRDNLPATVDALTTEAFFDVRSLQRLVEGGRWKQAREYIYRFVPLNAPMGVEARAVLRFLCLLNVLDDLSRGNPAGARIVDQLDRRVDADPSIMDADPNYGEVLRTIFHMHSHPQDRDSLDWRLVRHKAGEHVNYLIRQVPELTHLLQLPRCPINQHCTIPFGSGFGSRRRFQRKNIRREGKELLAVSEEQQKQVKRCRASLLARRFLPQKRCVPYANDAYADGPGFSCEPMAWLDALIHDALEAGEKKSFDYSSGEDASVATNPGKKHGITSANSGTKHLSQEDSCSGRTNGAKRPRTAGEFCEVAGLMFEVPDMKNVSGPENICEQSL
ncbi:hypothetical protein EJB05_39263 [Eragrostis curvula]|uniref:Uncharacterized protein n=1 Tax=Eragrostis curvula TaxID=38414 RepID=A0A5J9TWR0_9POAL|nr:hypothetical protein EJB05_39263 [Eragrostis curvula]